MPSIPLPLGCDRVGVGDGSIVQFYPLQFYWRLQSIFTMDRDRDAHHYLFNNILDDDKEVVKNEINTTRTNSNYSAPPSITLYDYDELEREILGDDNEESQDVCYKLPPKSPTKIPKKHKYSFDSFDEIGSGSLVKSQSLQPQYNEQRFDYYSYDYTQMAQYVPMYHYPSNAQIHNLIMEILKNSNEMARERNNSKNLQYYFQIASAEDKELIFKELVGDSMALAQDPFGNYVIQKIFEVGLKSQKQRLAHIFKGKITDLSFSPFGCRVVQRIIQSLANESKEQLGLIQEIFPHINKLIIDQNGNHVIQKLFEYFPPERTNDIANILLQNIEMMAFHTYGCRVLQKFLEKGNESPLFKRIMGKLGEMMIPLCKCSYGNYIMQYLVVNGPLEEKNKILTSIKSNFVLLSLDKFASNVVEKAILNGTEQFKKEILKILESPHLMGSEEGAVIGFVILAKGQYSNYVIQRYLQRSPRYIHESILALIPQGSTNLSMIKESQYGKHVLGQLGKTR